ncbi:RNA polymerase factor sigma-32 [Pikeienuella piscinae]|uniref:RNA polymerase factor sigma-32 n=1 Tax=Pikeienuella piscinae TaxID=2748098 RepID=A0A7M3T5C8_9RHOB|nr:RNA polymerase factor sigma-32 [Pikeienuella piscinae]
MARLDTQADASFTRTAMRAELLDAETERALASAWRDQRCARSLHRLIVAYMRLAISMASKYRRHGAPMADLIQEASVGLMKAAEKFDPDRGVRFSTYASWWIKASIQDYVMRDWSMVRTGSTSSQKALFFNFRRVRARLERESGSALDGRAAHEMREVIAAEVGVPLRDVEMMEARLSSADFSLNATQSTDEGREWIETLEDAAPLGAETVARASDLSAARDWIRDALDGLTERERMIIRRRKLSEEPDTLARLGDELGLSKERVRQLEAQALRKMKSRLETRHGAAPAALACEI